MGGYIQGLLESSAGYCSRLAAKADRQGIDNPRRPDESLKSKVSSLPQWDIASAESTGPRQDLIGSIDFGPVTRRSTRAIKLGFASNQVADIVVPKMMYEFPAYFPETARRKVLAARLRAEDALKEKRGGVTEFEIAEGLVCEFILDVLIAFVEEGHRLGMQELLTAAQFESECLKFVHCYSVAAGLFDGDFIARVVTDVPGDIAPGIERSERWRRCRKLLQEVADVQASNDQHDVSVRLKVGSNLTAAETVAEDAARLLAALSSKKSPKEFVDDYRLRPPRRSYEKLAGKIGLSKDTLYAITKETRWVSDENYRVVASICGCKPEDLYPRDVPRPERRRS